MNSVSDFIITPTNERYNNKISIGDKTLIVNSNIMHKINTTSTDSSARLSLQGFIA